MNAWEHWNYIAAVCSRVRNTIYAHMDNNGRMCRHLHSTTFNVLIFHFDRIYNGTCLLVQARWSPVWI